MIISSEALSGHMADMVITVANTVADPDNIKGEGTWIRGRQSKD